MGRNIFGWSYPPGCTQRHIDEAYGMEGPCECCGKDVDHCICPECPECGTHGDPFCYPKHGLKYTKEQIDGQIKLQESIATEAEAEREYLRDLLEDRYEVIK